MKVRTRKWFRARILEKFLLSLILCSAVVVFFYQAFLSQSPLLQVIHRVGSDAQAVMSPIAIDDSEDSIILQLVNFSTLPRAKVLINGEAIADFSHPFVTIPISEEDLVEVDVTYYDQPVVVKVLDTSKGIASPVRGKELSGSKTILVIGKVAKK